MKILDRLSALENVDDLLYLISKKVFNIYKKKLKFGQVKKYVSSGKDCEYLCIVVAGFQPFYWDVVLGRVKRCQESFAKEITICICNSGKPNRDLEGYAQAYGWDYLYLGTDRLGRAQNMAIRLHPKAKYIFKIDEDIVLPNDYFNMMDHAALTTKNSFSIDAGFYAPLINVNGYGTKYFLEGLNSLSEYEKEFGRYDVSNVKGSIHQNPKAAIFCWQRSLPFDKVASKIAQLYEGKTCLCPFRFSVGAILFSRLYWNELDGFETGLNGETGLEELQMNEFCMNHMRGIVIIKSVLVGHLGFYTQKESIHKFFENNIEDIKYTE